MRGLLVGAKADKWNNKEGKEQRSGELHFVAGSPPSDPRGLVGVQCMQYRVSFEMAELLQKSVGSVVEFDFQPVIRFGKQESDIVGHRVLGSADDYLLTAGGLVAKAIVSQGQAGKLGFAGPAAQSAKTA